jgi:hypothetical protein
VLAARRFWTRQRIVRPDGGKRHASSTAGGDAPATQPASIHSGAGGGPPSYGRALTIAEPAERLPARSTATRR